MQAAETIEKSSNVIPFKPKILVVDDRKENHRVIKKILQDIDATIYDADSGEDALSLTLRHHFAVVLLDVMMPVMDGFDTASLMRINEATRYTPIIFITAAEQNDDFECRGYDIGAVDYLFKPIRPHALVGKVKVLLEIEQQRYRIKQTLEDIQRLENRNKLLLKSVGEGIIGLDKSGIVTFSNPAAQNLLGYCEADLEHKNIMELLYVADSSMPQMQWEDCPAYTHCMRGEAYYENIGVFWNQQRELFPAEYTATPIQDGDNFLGIVIAFQDITERKKTEAQLARLAQYDALTGLINRNSFGKHLSQSLARASRTETSLALLFIDLDRFKQVNDNLGHDIGDCLLQEAALRLKDCVRDGDIISRIGGDEFTVLLETINIGRNAAKVAQKIVKSLALPFHIRENQVFIGASIGIATYPESAQHADSLMRCADMAMYKAKEHGRNNYRFFTDTMQREVTQALALENDLRFAVQDQDFMLYYQPKIQLTDDKVCGMEALIRWQNKKGELISPDYFISKAEEMGLINEIGEWVLRTGCQQMQLWRQQGLICQDETIAINLSMRQLLSPSLPQLVEQVLKETGLPAQHLELEVTESMMMRDPDTTIKRLKTIRQLGVKIALDDFGTGYSSLSYLRYLPIDTLKIDKSFVQQLSDSKQNEAIVMAIITLAHSLDLHVVAEGVETAAQLEFLKQYQCDIVQGYLYQKPLPLDSFVNFVNEHKA